MAMWQKVLWAGKGSHHHRLEVIQKNGIRFLRFGRGGGWQGAFDESFPQRPVFAYQRAFASYLHTYLNLDSFCSLGVGTGTSLRSVRNRFPNCRLTAIDVDHEVIHVAKRHFYAPPDDARSKYVVGDGIAYLCEQEQTFDLIFVDVYSKNEIYSPCLDPAFVHVLHKNLSSHGSAVCNVIYQAPERGRVLRFLEEACKRFSCVMKLPVGRPFTEQNVLIVLSKRTDAFESWRISHNNAHLSLVEKAFWRYRMKHISLPVI